MSAFPVHAGRMLAVRLVWLVGVWLVLWSDLSLANVVSGLLVAGAIVATFRGWRPGHVVVRPLAALRFAAYFAYKLVESTIGVALAVIAPRGRIHTGIVAVDLHPSSDAIVTLVADAVNLTPGTLIVDVRRAPLTLYVHALDVRDVPQIRRSVHRLETLAVDAFGSRREWDGIELPDRAGSEQ